MTHILIKVAGLVDDKELISHENTVEYGMNLFTRGLSDQQLFGGLK